MRRQQENPLPMCVLISDHSTAVECMRVLLLQCIQTIHILLYYQTMVVREARRCGRMGWQAFDTMFRQQVANNPKVDWSKLNSSLYAATFLAQQNGKGKSCLFCLETDHAAFECALASTKPHHPPSQEARRAKSDRSPKVCYSWNDGRCAVPYCRYRHICAKCQGDHKAMHRASCPSPKPFQAHN